MEDQASRREWIDRWLAEREFTGNPFAEWEASKEPLLGKYFVNHPYYDEIANEPRTAFILAPRGCGKSANRIMIENRCQPHNKNGTSLGISYADFSSLIDPVAHRRPTATLLSHIRLIIRTGLESLVLAVSQRGDLEVNLTTEAYAELAELVNAHHPTLTSRQVARSLVSRFMPERTLPEVARFVEQSLDSLVADSVPAPVAHLLKVLNEIRRQQGAHPSSTQRGGLEWTRRFVDTVQLIGLSSIYVLVDGIDEYALTSSDPTAAFEILRPLVTELRLLEMPRLAFKFFLPLEMAGAVSDITRTRSDRLRQVYLTWDDADLSQLLALRIKAFNTSGITSLAPFCDADLRLRIDDELVRRANHSPRTLMRLGYLLLAEHCRWQPAQLIAYEEWERALARARAMMGESLATGALELTPPVDQPAIPLLSVVEETRNVLIGGQRLVPPLSNMEFKLVAYLYRQKGRACPVEDILDKVYESSSPEEERSEAAVAQLVKRVRQRLEPATVRRPVYLKNSRGRGYLLDHTDRAIVNLTSKNE
jgi:DNA-binding winged helix-turn-helix (wHTH) protein